MIIIKRPHGGGNIKKKQTHSDNLSIRESVIVGYIIL